MKIIILLGKSGCGKGTQAKLLQKEFDFDYIGSGDLLRKRAEKEDFTGKKLKEIFNSGGLVPTPVILKLWLDKVEQLKEKKDLKGIIMDGNPRKIFEAYLMDEVFEYYGWEKNIQAILIDISDQEAMDRLLKRRMCQDCSKIIPFVGEFKEMKECPDCQGSLIVRSDDTKESVQQRLAWFKKDVQPIIDYYEKKNILTKINGEQSIEKVSEDILSINE